MERETVEGNMHYLHLTAIATIGILLGSVEHAHALQTHGPPEGIYVHQMAHALFTAALMYLYWHTGKTQETSGRGWKYFQVFCIFLILWNILAFTGHETFEHLGDTDIVDKDTWQARLSTPITTTKLLYYITKMDHFLIVPALFALVMSLRAFYREALREAGK